MPKAIDDTIILSTIERGLDSLGTIPKQAIWFYLEQEFGFSRKSIPENLPTFIDVLQKFFGLGYRFLDTLFCQYLQEATGENLEGYTTFLECVEALRLSKSTFLHESRALR
jgi:hypothetical protein